MRSRSLLAFFVASTFVIAAAPRARAQQGPPEATVHVGTPGVTLELRPNADHAWQVGCVAPCDVRVPVLYEYRIAGSGVQPSKPFRITAAKVDISADPGSRGVHTAGVAADIIGGLAIVGWFFYIIIGTANDASGSNDAGHALKDRATDGIGLTLILGGVGLSIAGAIMQAATETEVTQRALIPVVHPVQPGAARTPVWRDASAMEKSAPAAVTVPVLSFRF
jgi:hypothetical protein